MKCVIKADLMRSTTSFFTISDFGENDMKNAGKKFEQLWKPSAEKQDLFILRLNYTDMSFNSFETVVFLFESISTNLNPPYIPSSFPMNLSLKYKCPEYSPPNG